MPSHEYYLALAEGVFLKELEFPAVYHAGDDELYEVDPGGFAELSRCDGTLPVSESSFPVSFLEFCMEEGLLEYLEAPAARRLLIGKNEDPSFRYLVAEVTDSCNLVCRHCYLGEGGSNTLGLRQAIGLMDEFEDMGGLRLVVTGGEPVLHSDFASINDAVAERAFRSILVTNATLLSAPICTGLRFNEVQVSLDGMEKGHNYLRGDGSFKSALAGIECVREAGVDVSVATMVHRRNIDELDELEKLVRSLDALSWTLDVPSECGRLAPGAEVLAPESAAAVQLARAFGSEQHEASGNWACGAHLACVKATGVLTKCGFYDERTGGALEGGLRKAWLDMPRVRLDELECRCKYLYQCGGGCRFRAEAAGNGRLGPDPVKCAEFGVVIHGDGQTATE